MKTKLLASVLGLLLVAGSWWLGQWFYGQAVERDTAEATRRMRLYDADLKRRLAKTEVEIEQYLASRAAEQRHDAAMTEGLTPAGRSQYFRDKEERKHRETMEELAREQLEELKRQAK